MAKLEHSSAELDALRESSNPIGNLTEEAALPGFPALDSTAQDKEPNSNSGPPGMSWAAIAAKAKSPQPKPQSAPPSEKDEKSKTDGSSQAKKTAPTSKDKKLEESADSEEGKSKKKKKKDKEKPKETNTTDSKDANQQDTTGDSSTTPLPPHLARALAKTLQPEENNNANGSANNNNKEKKDKRKKRKDEGPEEANNQSSADKKGHKKKKRFVYTYEILMALRLLVPPGIPNQIPAEIRVEKSNDPVLNPTLLGAWGRKLQLQPASPTSPSATNAATTASAVTSALIAMATHAKASGGANASTPTTTTTTPTKPAASASSPSSSSSTQKEKDNATSTSASKSANGKRKRLTYTKEELLELRQYADKTPPKHIPNDLLPREKRNRDKEKPKPAPLPITPAEPRKSPPNTEAMLLAAAAASVSASNRKAATPAKPAAAAATGAATGQQSPQTREQLLARARQQQLLDAQLLLMSAGASLQSADGRSVQIANQLVAAASSGTAINLHAAATAASLQSASKRQMGTTSSPTKATPGAGSPTATFATSNGSSATFSSSLSSVPSVSGSRQLLSLLQPDRVNNNHNTSSSSNSSSSSSSSTSVNKNTVSASKKAATDWATMISNATSSSKPIVIPVKAPPAPRPPVSPAPFGVASGGGFIYTAVQLTQASQELLLSEFGCLIPTGWTHKADHMTICLGTLNQPKVSEHTYTEEVAKSVLSDCQLNQHKKLMVIEVGESATCMAVRVNGCPSLNLIPHITLAVAPHGRSVDSNYIENWMSWRLSVVEVEGVVEEFGT